MLVFVICPKMLEYGILQQQTMTCCIGLVTTDNLILLLFRLAPGISFSLLGFMNELFEFDDPQ